MYELMQLTEKCYYIQCPAKIGLVRLNDTDVALIDSGNDKEAGKKVKKLLDSKGWRLAAIYNTHSNADHIGGNKYLQAQTGCKIYAPGIERDFTRHTILEPAFLYGGYPPKELRHKFLLAQESEAEELTQAVLPEGMEMIPLPGHFFDMVGFACDGVVFLADCLSSRETLEKYRIGFIYDVGAYLDTLERVKAMEAQIFVPAHAAPAEEIAGLAQYNIDSVHAVAEKILDVCRAPLCFEDILQRLFADYQLTMSFEQYALVGSTVKSYLSWLKDNGRLNARIEWNKILWECI
ncbi:MAG: MBL fold metallo-hydrolase [Clostridia bacterium]|nr:MBL fold metallo-hydrolase [Clostridia bacterium]